MSLKVSDFFNLAALFSLFFFGAGGYLLSSNIKDLRGSEAATGTVVEVVTKRDAKNRTLYSPVVAFKTKEGSEARFTSKMSSGLEGYYEKGESVKVWYRPENPSNAKIDSFFELYAFPSLFIFAGLLIFYLGVRKSSKQQ